MAKGKGKTRKDVGQLNIRKKGTPNLTRDEVDYLKFHGMSSDSPMAAQMLMKAKMSGEKTIAPKRKNYPAQKKKGKRKA